MDPRIATMADEARRLFTDHKQALLTPIAKRREVVCTTLKNRLYAPSTRLVVAP